MPTLIKAPPIAQIRDLCQPALLIPNLFAGGIVGLVTLTFSLSCAALVFSGPLVEYFPIGMGCALISASLSAMVVAWFSSFPFAIAGPDAHAAAILALMASAIATQLTASGDEVQVFANVWVAIVVSTVLTGIFLFTMGRLRLGRWVRFVPYPVVGGFLAGTGWLITRGSFVVMTGMPLGAAHLTQLLEPEQVMHWLPGLVFALVLIGALNRYQHVLVMPTILVGAIALFHLVWYGINSRYAMNPDGWFLAPFSNDQVWQAWSLSTFTQLDQTVLVGQIGTLVAMMLVVVIAILLNATGVELATQQDGDLDRELRVNGIANLVTGLCGGMVGYLSLSRSLLSHRAKATSPLAGMVAGIFCGGLLLVDSTFLSVFPTSILGGLLLYLGLSLLIEWLYRAFYKFPRLDYALIVVILITIALWGFLEGVGVGIIIACLLFAVNYSRNQVIRHTFTGATHQSNVKRSFHQQRFLRQRGEQIYILLLQGYIFFGTASTLLEQVRQRTLDASAKLRFLVLDFRLVNGLDSSVVLTFIKMKQLAQREDVHLVFTNLQPTVLHQLQEGGCIEDENPLCHVYPDLDRGIEWCEEQILETMTQRRRRSLPMALQLSELFPTPDSVSDFMGYLQQTHVATGHMLVRQGDMSDSLYFVESGQVTMFLELEGGATRRMQTLGAGTILGEMAFYLRMPHRTSAVADLPSKLYCLSYEALQRMQVEKPAAAAAFQEFVIRLLADRLAYAYEEIGELLQS